MQYGRHHGQRAYDGFDVRGPEKHGVLKCRGAEDQGEEPHQPMRLKRPM